MLELIPISTVLSTLTSEIIDIACAVNDVLVEKENFRALGKLLEGVQPVLLELRNRDMKESSAVRRSLEYLHSDVKKAKILADSFQKKSKFYQLIHCRNILKEAERISHSIASSLALLSLASTDVAVDIRDDVEKLRDQMLTAEFRTSEQNMRILEKIEMGLRQEQHDQAFANSLIRDIAKVVGVPVDDDSEIKKEMEILRREKEDASARKAREEEIYMEQILALLSTADTLQRTMVIDASSIGGCEQPFLPSFLCPLSHEIMRDPVTICTGKTFERYHIEAWFASGEKTDPSTGVPLSDLGLRPNVLLKKTIEEWREYNNRVRIKKAGENLVSGDKSMVLGALEDLCLLCYDSLEMKEEIAEERLVSRIVANLKSRDKELKQKCLCALQLIVSGSHSNQEQVVDADGVKQIVGCLGRDNLSKMALPLLLELLGGGLQDEVAKNFVVHKKLIEATGSIILLVALLNSKDVEAAKTAKRILEELCYEDQNIINMANANWFAPMIDSLHRGPDKTKLLMARTLAEMELAEHSRRNLGDAIAPLVAMMSGDLQAKAAALKALENITVSGNNKKYLAEAGAVPIVLQIVSSGRYPVNVRISAGAILEKIVSDDGGKYLVDGEENALDLSRIIQSLLVLQENSVNTQTIRKYVLLTLLRLVSSEDGHDAIRLLIDADGLSTLLPLSECPESDVRDIAIQLLCCLSSECSHEISHFLIQSNLGGSMASLLRNSLKGDVQDAVAGILANLPLEDSVLTSHLVEGGVLQATVHALVHGSTKTKENAVGSLLRFTLPSNVMLQRKVVELGIFTILKDLLVSGTDLCKQRAANVLRNLSMSTMQLSRPPHRSGCYVLRKNPPSACRVHLGPCSERGTFCLVEAGVIPNMVLLLNAQGSDAAAGAAIGALRTLMMGDGMLERGANLLHDADAITPILRRMANGPEGCSEEAVEMVEGMLKVRRMKERYGGHARLALVEMATNGKGRARKRAAGILAALEALIHHQEDQEEEKEEASSPSYFLLPHSHRSARTTRPTV